MRKISVVFNKKHLLVLFLPFICLQCYAQFGSPGTYTAPSPSAASALRNLDAVNMYKGIPQIGVELCNLNIRGGSIPLNLSYNASGHKVQDVSSTVGLGWSISSNSLISRIVRGLPDEDTNGFFNGMGQTVMGVLTENIPVATLNEIISNTKDSEADLFFFTLNGQGGTLVFDKDKNPYMLSNQGFKVLNSPFKKELGIDGWIISDIQGNKYTLGTDGATVEKSITTKITSEFPSSWFLKSIETPNGIETITYEYTTGSATVVNYYSKSMALRNKITRTTSREVKLYGIRLRKEDVDTDIDVVDRSISDENMRETVVNPKYLTSMTSSNETAHFIYDSGMRSDLSGGKILSKVQIKNLSGSVIKEFKLNSSYQYSKDIDLLEDFTFYAEIRLRYKKFLSSGISGFLNFFNEETRHFYHESLSWFPTIPDYDNAAIDWRLSQLYWLRGRIEGMSETEYINEVFSLVNPGRVYPITQSPDKFRLQLNDIELLMPDAPALPLYRFQYNEMKLPPRYSRKTDHWGYYNNNTYGYFPVEDWKIENAKVPDRDKMKAGILQRITYQSGGYKEFNFEANIVYDSKPQLHSTVGGLRIAKITNVGGLNTPPIVKRYSYAFGKRTMLPPAYQTSVSHTDKMYPAFLPLMPMTPIRAVPSNVRQIRSMPHVPPSGIPGAQPPPGMNENLLQKIFAVGTAVVELLQKPDEEVFYTPFIITTTASLNNLFDSDGVAVGYSEVTEETAGSGRIVSTFSDINDSPDVFEQYQITPNFTSSDSIHPNQRPFTPPTSYAFARGLLKESKFYEEIGGATIRLIKKITNQYTFNTQEPGVLGFRCALAKVEYVNGWRSTNDLFNIGYYRNIRNAPIRVVSTEETFDEGITYLPNSVPVTLTRKSTSNFSADYPMLLLSDTVTNSDGAIITQENKYVVDKALVSFDNQTEIDAANKLYSEGRFAVLLQQTTKVNGAITDISKSGFKKWVINNKQLVLPETVYSGSGGPMRPRFIVYQYDEYGNTLSAGKFGAVKTSTKWGHNNLLPIAEAQNAAPEEIFFEDFEQSSSQNVSSGNAYSGKKYFSGDYSVPFISPNTKAYKVSYYYYLNGSWYYSGSMPYVNSMVLTLGDAIDQVAIIPADAKLTSYTYDPKSFGITSATDSRGETSFYEYDHFQRLQLVRDSKGYIIKKYDYHNQP